MTNRHAVSPSANDGAGTVGPATQRTDCTGAPDSTVKSVRPLPTGMLSTRSRLLHKVSMPN